MKQTAWSIENKYKNTVKYAEKLKKKEFLFIGFNKKDALIPLNWVL